MEHKHLFIAGLHRSGTSLLHSMICEYEDVSGFANTGVPEDEGQHLQEVFQAANQSGGAGEFAFDDACAMDENHALVSEDSRHKILEKWSAHWDMNCSILVEKSPPTLIRSRFFQSLFPNSYFIFIRRHPIAVTMATSKWNDAPLPRLMEHWVKAHQRAEADIPHLTHSLQLSYEELVECPEETMSRVEKFLDLPHITHKNTLRAGINDKYLDAWKQQIASGTITEDDVAKLTNQCKHFGYDL